MGLASEQILKIFRESGALLEGHFILTSGLHSASYFQCALVFQYPECAEALCRDLAEYFQPKNIDTVVSPAVGGIVTGYEIARILGARSIFTERVDGKMTLRRGFSVSPGESILVVEDVTTTGGSVREVIDVMKKNQARVVGVGAVVDRSGGTIDFGVHYHALLQMQVEAFKPDVCPMCAAGSRAVKPGSRGLK
ncbi:orotate phosphoribosyltransferase [bacterium]|nr:orotate phosphoribosyltransferase [bacterium]